MNELDHVRLENEVVDALFILRRWVDKGRKLRGYVYGHGREYLSYLIGFDCEDGDPTGFRVGYHNSGSDIIKQIKGPYGWVLLQALIKQREAADAEKLKQRQAVRAHFRMLKENNDTGL